MKRNQRLPIVRNLALVVVVLFALLGVQTTAFAAEQEVGGAPKATPRAPARIQLSVNGGYGPVELAQEGDAWKGAFEVKNLGPGELDVTRVSVRTSQTDPRMPAGVDASFEDGKPNAHLGPGASKRVVVRWTPAKVTTMKELYGHIAVESNSSDHQAAAMGVHAELPSPAPWLYQHILTWLTFLPMAGLVLIFLAYLAGYDDARSAG